MGKTIVKVSEAVANRVGISFNMDNCQSTMFLTQEEFLYMFAEMFDYKGRHEKELREICERNAKRFGL